MTRRRVPRWLEAARSDPQKWQAGAKPEWVGRVLSRAGILTGHALDSALRDGRISVGDRVARTPMVLANPDDVVTLDGHPVPRSPPVRVLMFHKPRGSVTSTTDPHEGKTVFADLLPQLPPELSTYGWHAVGRLDRGTTGLLLFTNDERLVEHLTAPATHLPKRYIATVQGQLTEARLEPLRHGIELDDGMTRPANVQIRGAGLVELTLTEGKNHQVKRMLSAVGLPVTALHREAVGTLTLNVEVGAWRELTPEEIKEGLRFPPEAATPG